MSKKIAAAIVTLLVGCWVKAYAQGCQLAGAVAWSEQTRYLLSGCENRFPSPNGRLVLTIDERGGMRLVSADSKLIPMVGPARVEGPGILSWSAKSDAFFIDEGQGSGETSVLRVFRVAKERTVEQPEFQRRAVALYRREKKCGDDTYDPDVRGIGWSQDGARLHLLVQATIHQPCGPPGAFLGLTMDAVTAQIVDRLSESRTRREFRELLPPQIRDEKAPRFHAP